MAQVQQERGLSRAIAVRRSSRNDRKRHLQVAVTRFGMNALYRESLRPLLLRGPGWTNNVAFLTAPRVPSFQSAALLWVASSAVLFAGSLLAISGGLLSLVGVLVFVAGVASVVLAGMSLASAMEYRGHAGSLCVGNVVAYRPEERAAPRGAGAAALLGVLITEYGWASRPLVLRSHAADSDRQDDLIAFYARYGFVRVPGQADDTKRPFYVRAADRPATTQGVPRSPDVG